MGLFSKVFGNNENQQPVEDEIGALVKEQVRHGGKRCSRQFWGSIYLGAFAPQLKMAVFKGKKISTEGAEKLVRDLHGLLGEDSIGIDGWDEGEDPMNVEDDQLSRHWEIDSIDVNLMIDNHHPSDDPVMLSITNWPQFQELVRIMRS